MISNSRFVAWPAYVDLFAGLLIVTFGAVVLLVDEYAPLMVGNTKGQIKQAQLVANTIFDALESNPVDGVTYTRCSAEDICINVTLEFETDADLLLPAGQEQISRISEGLLRSFDGIPTTNKELARQCLQIVVEGHTDSSQPKRVTDERVRFKWNWDLSARRASSVLFAMKTNGISRDAGYNVSSLGAADSEPLCTEATADCERTNRRTTIRLRFDYKRYAAIAPEHG